MNDYAKVIWRDGKWWLTLLFLCICLLLTSRTTQAAPLAQVGCLSVMTVSDESQLNNAIACYNMATTAGEYVINLANDISLTASTTAINNANLGVSLRIEGNGHTVNGQNISGVRPFTIVSGTIVTMQAITITRGNVASSGGGIRNEGTLSVVNSTISHNTASNHGGGIYNDGTLSVVNSTISHNTAYIGGGGIFSFSMASVVNSTISDNTSDYGGGIYNEDTLTIHNSTISGNTATNGGGIRSWGQLTLANTIIANSLNGGDCSLGSGTIHASYSLIADGLGCVNGTDSNNLTGDPLLGPLQDNGGPTFTHALLPGSPAIDKGNNAAALDAAGQPLSTDQRGFSRILDGDGDTVATVDIGAYELFACGLNMTAATELDLNAAIACFNAATTPGEYVITLANDILLSASTVAISNSTAGVSLRIDGATHSVDGQEIDDVRPFRIAAGTVVTLQDITVTRGNDVDGGGIRNGGTLTITNSTISHNSATDEFGGGIWNSNNGTLTIHNSTISNNTADYGGGILNEGTLTITHSTISRNTANWYGGGILNYRTLTITDSTISSNTASRDGGGIENWFGTLTISNSTISSNTASRDGGGIDNYQGTLTIYNSTLSNNTSNDNGGGIYQVGNTATTTLANTIIANSTSGGDCSNAGGTINASYSLFGDNLSCVNGTNTENITGDPQLGPLQDNGGPTFTHALLPTSPALDAGDNAICAAAPVSNVDQRGIVRPQGIICDIGAYEADTAPIAFIKNVVGGVAQPSAWSFTVDSDPTPIAHNETVTLTFGSHIVTESGPAGYTLTGAGGACALNNGQIGLTVTTAGGTCTITNTRQTGQITFIKDADGGPSDDNQWTFSLISGPAGATLPTNIANQQSLTLDTGVYIVTETGPLDYHLKRGEGVCEVVNGQIQLTVTPAGGICEVDNDRDTGTVRFIKQVVNGPSQPSDWRFNLVSGPLAAPLQTAIPHNSVRELDTGSYVLTESGPPGYAAVSASGACSLVNGQLQLTAIITPTTCTITNTQMTVLVNEFFGNSWVSEGAISGDGSQACVWLALNNEPSGPVTISLTPRNGQVTLDKSSITLDGTNWNRFDLAQRDNILCIRAVDDTIDESGAEQCKDGLSERFAGSVVPNDGCGDHLDFVDLAITSSADPNFGAFTPFVSNTLRDLDFSAASIDVLVQDNDQAGVTLTPAYGVAVVDEDGAPRPEACYWVTLNSQPTHPVTVAAFPDSQLTVTPASVTLDASNWNLLDSQQTVNRICVTAVDDAIDEPAGNFCADRLANPFGGAVTGQSCGDHLGFVRHSVASTDGKYNGTTNFAGIGPNFDADLSTLDVLIRDDDVVGIRFIPTSLSIIEGNTGTYQVVLTSQPTGDVIVDNGHGSSVTFTPANWHIPQTLSITIPDNDVIDGSREQPLPHQVASSDPAYDVLEPILPLLILDNDSPSVEIVLVDAPTGQLEVAEGGKTASYTLRLTARPQADIVVTPVVDDQVTVSQSSLTFTAANWNLFQTIVVTAVDDDRVEPTLISPIRHTMSSSDPAYNGQQAPVVDVQVLDNDVAGIELVASTPLQLSEGALHAAQLTASYQLRLTSEPASEVTVLVNIAGQATASPTSLTFTPADWNIFQGVTLAAIDDEIDQGASYDALVSHTVLSADPDYDGLPVTDLPVLILDDDQAGVIVTPTALTVTVGLTGTYSVVLTSEPLGPVQIELTPAGPFRTTSRCDSGEAEALCLTFTPANWNIPQTVTIFGLNAGTGLVGHQVVSSDVIYAAQLAAPVDVTVTGHTASNPYQPEPGATQSRLFLPLVGK